MLFKSGLLFVPDEKWRQEKNWRKSNPSVEAYDGDVPQNQKPKIEGTPVLHIKNKTPRKSEDSVHHMI